MIYMDDAIRATMEVMNAPAKNIKTRTSYNLSGLNFTPKELVLSIQQYFPGFQVNYKPDFRQEIADSWPDSIDDKEAKTDWSWTPEFDLAAMSETMIKHLKEQYAKAQANSQL